MAADGRTSLWLAGERREYPALDGSVTVDVAVLGGGITGLTAAYLLARAGRSVVVAELGRIGQGASGNTTAKLTVGHGLAYTELVRRYGDDAARLYAESNQAAIDRIEEIAESAGIACDLERTSNIVYTESDDNVAALEEEAQAAERAGVQARVTKETDLPFGVEAALLVENQAQFHPGRYLAGLAEHVGQAGGWVYEHTRALAVRSGDPCMVRTPQGEIRARDVVVATHLPFLDRGLFFAKAHPGRSYAIAGRVDAAAAPRGMYITVEWPLRSIRSAPGPDGTRWLIVGGEGHKIGDEPDTRRRYEALERFLQERFGGEVEHRWSAHDFFPVDGLPFVGRVRRADDHVHTATGFAKWGLTKGTIAAEIISDGILGQENRWSGLYDSGRRNLRRSLKRAATENGRVALRLVGDRVRQRPGRSEVDQLGPGEGVLARVGGRLRAFYRDDDGTLHTLSPRCTHLGCIVSWNTADRMWNAPATRRASPVTGR